jgi:hypothetical protein
LAQNPQVEKMIFSQFGGPVRKVRLKRLSKVGPTAQFNHMTLTIIKADGFNMTVAIQCPSQAHG